MSEQESQFLLILFGGIFFAFLMSLFVVGMVVLHRQRQVQNRQKIDNLKAEYERTILNIENEIQQETLAHVGRELHDNIGQLLSLAKLNLNSAKPEKQAEGKEFINQIIKEVRGLSKTLNLDWVEEITLDDFIRQQLQRIESTGYCQTVFDSDQSFLELPKDKKLVLIRVIQECLNNAIKHASPAHLKVHIIGDSTLRKIEITDDGYGFDTTAPSSGSGMTNLKKRMETIGGSFSLSSTVGKGTQITLNLPL
ncbi:MAG: sensor histidine kinase [Algoriphagus aquaeductus]|uniref:sensor histidine kinase n=1 Tax=Algoriphagus TaxID=246875 RepID=UPI0025851475|nr:ATP-binding protein [Algoriphagus sp.]